MAVPASELFTPLNIISVGTATAAVTAATTVAYKLLKIDPKWTAFVAALLIAFVIVAMKPSPQWFEWVLAFFNGCLLFCSALGLNEMGVHAVTPPGQNFAGPKTLLESWLKSKQP